MKHGTEGPSGGKQSSSGGYYGGPAWTGHVSSLGLGRWAKQKAELLDSGRTKWVGGYLEVERFLTWRAVDTWYREERGNDDAECV